MDVLIEKEEKVMKKIAIFNNKGGVGKTTSVINIAYALHKAGKKTLVVDCDTQANCYYFFLSGKANKILPTKYENIAHTTYQDFTGLNSDELAAFDFVLLDLPPVLSDEIKAIIAASDKVYVPLMLRRFELAGLSNLVANCGEKLGGIYVTMYKNRDEEMFDEFRQALGDRLMDTAIPYSDAIIDSQREGLPLEEYFENRGVPRHLTNAWKAADAYTALAKEIMEVQ